MGNPFANWLIEHQYPNAIEPQATAPEFGATLPGETTPPDNGQGGDMTPVWSNANRHYVKNLGIKKVKFAFFKEVPGSPAQFISQTELIPVPEGTDIVSYVEYTEEPENPSPPPVVLTLPQGSKGVDVSYWQGAYNWAESGAEFGIIRCSDGMTANSATHDENGVDRQFWANAGKLAALGIPWSIYHFLRPGSLQEQADKVLGILYELAMLEQFPKTAVLDNGVLLPTVFIDVEDAALKSADVQAFYDLIAGECAVGIYTGKPIWEAITAGAAVWWSDVPLWIANYGVNNGDVPNYPNGPALPRGWGTAVAWQYTSIPIDKNIIGPYPANAPAPPTPPPPTAQTVDLLPWIRGPHRRQFDKEYKLANGVTGTQTTQVFWLNDAGTDWLYIKGEKGEYEHLGIRQWNGQPWVFRFEDTSESPSRWYAHFMSSSLESIGAPWLPQFCEVGKWYETAKFVQHYQKDSAGKPTCTKENSGNVVDKLRVISEPYNRTYQSGKTVQVVTVEWASGEQYDFAGGNIAFRNTAGDNFWFMQWLEGRADKTYKKVDCLPVGW